MYTPLPAITEPLEVLSVRLKQERDAQLRPRLHLLVLIQSGQVRSRQAAAAHLAVHRNTVGRWLAAYQSGGLEQLLTSKRAGGIPGQKTLAPPVWQALQDRLQQDGFSSYGAVQRWLAQEWGQSVCYKTVHRLVRYTLRAKLKRARPLHAKQTPRSASTSPLA
jgi:transposase